MRIAPHALLDRRASRCDARCVTMHAPCTPLARSDWLRQALSFARTTSPGLLLQVEYYFSEGNFAKDKFMQAETAKTKEQWVNIRADTYAPGPFAGLFLHQPPACRTCRRHRAACPRVPTPLHVHRTRASLGRAAYRQYRVSPAHHRLTYP